LRCDQEYHADAEHQDALWRRMQGQLAGISLSIPVAIFLRERAEFYGAVFGLGCALRREERRAPRSAGTHGGSVGTGGAIVDRVELRSVFLTRGDRNGFEFDGYDVGGRDQYQKVESDFMHDEHERISLSFDFASL
jgi:hypothetical protein